jgi:hypothetical protein
MCKVLGLILSSAIVKEKKKILVTVIFLYTVMIKDVTQNEYISVMIVDAPFHIRNHKVNLWAIIRSNRQKSDGRRF